MSEGRHLPDGYLSFLFSSFLSFFFFASESWRTKGEDAD